MIPISEHYSILRYDQVVHIFGFFTMTLVSYEIIQAHIKNLYKKDLKVSFWIWLVLVMAGCWFGALNEVIEFIVDQSLPESGVGGYINTSLDLVSNLIWAILGIIVIKIFLEKK